MMHIDRRELHIKTSSTDALERSTVALHRENAVGPLTFGFLDCGIPMPLWIFV
jgi:hypothetical protein